MLEMGISVDNALMSMPQSILKSLIIGTVSKLRVFWSKILYLQCFACFYKGPLVGGHLWIVCSSYSPGGG